MPIFRQLIEIADRIDRNTGLPENVNKPYLILAVQYGENTDPSEEYETVSQGEFYAIKGRRNVFQFIVETLNIYNIDLLKSYILSGNISFGKEITLYTFLRICIEKYRYGGVEHTVDSLNESVINSYEAEGKKIDVYKLTSIYNQELSAPAS